MSQGRKSSRTPSQLISVSYNPFKRSRLDCLNRFESHTVLIDDELGCGQAADPQLISLLIRCRPYAIVPRSGSPAFTFRTISMASDHRLVKRCHTGMLLTPGGVPTSDMQLLDVVHQDARYALRLLWRAKAFTTAAVLTLAPGIAATTVMFALIQGVLLRPLPVQEQERLILSWREASTAGSASYPFGDVEIEAVARESRLLESAAGVTRNGVGRAVVSDGSASSYANVGLITGNFFEVLGAQALLGRRFTLADDRNSAEPVAVISHGYWRRQFGGVADVVGRRITIDEQPCVIVGVMPPDLDYPRGVEIWRTTRSIPTDGPFGIAAQREVNLIGRLHPGVTVDQASSELAALNQQLATDARTDSLRQFHIVVRPFTEMVIVAPSPTADGTCRASLPKAKAMIRRRATRR